MSDIFKKLNLKDQKEILVLNPPESFEPELATLTDVVIQRSIEGLQQIDFALAFVTKQAEVDSLAKAIAQRAEGDAILWLPIPKPVPRTTLASSTATPVGPSWANWVSKAFARWRLMRTGQQSAFGGWNSSSRSHVQRKTG